MQTLINTAGQVTPKTDLSNVPTRTLSDMLTAANTEVRMYGKLCDRGTYKFNQVRSNLLWKRVFKIEDALKARGVL